MKLIPFLILVLLFSQRSSSQESAYPKMTLLVIATNGLKLREGPGTQFKTIIAAPFGAEVIFMEAADMPFDTVQKISIKHSEEYTSHTNVQATWMKVKYENKIGYMYSLYLYPNYNQQEHHSFQHPNNNFQIFSKVNGGISENFKFIKNNYWYEIIQDSEGYFSLNSIKVELISTYLINECRENEASWKLIAQREDRKSNSRILYSAKKLATGKVNSQPINDFNSQLRSLEEMERYNRINRGEFNTLKNKLIEKFSLRISSESNHNTGLMFKHNGKESVFSRGWDVTYLSMVADIDSDGIMDYIITTGSEHQTTTGLFLSSEADEESSHKLVATFYHDIGCYE